MKYYNYVNLPNWKKHQADIIAFRNQNPPPKEMLDAYAEHTPDGQDPYVSWYCFFEDTIKKELPDLYNDFAKMGLDVHQMIFFDNKPNKEDVTDPTDPMCPFIHIDAKDEEEWEETQFDPVSAFNIPLENCENSFTTFYEIIDESLPHVYYPNFYLCGGVDPKNVKEVERFTLVQPAVIRVNVPHAVLNPTDNIRQVVTFRFYNDIEFLFDK